MAPSILIDGQPDQDVVTITNTGVLLAMYSWTPATRNVDLFGAQRIPFKRPAGSGRSDVVIKLRGAADVVSVAGEIPARNGEVLREEVLLVSADIQAGTDTVLATGPLPEPRALPSSEWTCCPPSCTSWETRWGCRKPRARVSWASPCRQRFGASRWWTDRGAWMPEVHRAPNRSQKCNPGLLTS